MNTIPNQPVTFDLDFNCTEDIDIPQLVDKGDVTQFQLQLDVCSSTPNSITNNQFANDTDWNLGDNWNINDNMLCHLSGATDTLNSTVVLSDSKYYQVTIIVDSIEFGATFNVFLGVNILGVINSIGTYVFYAFPITGFGISSVLITPVNDGDMCISEIDVYEVLLNELVLVKDLNDNVVAQISYNDNPDYFTISEDSMTINIDWTDLGVTTDGCYRLCLADVCENTNGQNYPPIILFGTFATGAVDVWTAEGDDVTFNSGSVTLISTGAAKNESFLLEQDIFSSFLNSYCVIINIVVTDGAVGVWFGDNLIQEITATGTYTITGTPLNYLSIRFRNEDDVTQSVLNSVVACEITEITCNKTSNLFKLADYSGACTMLVNICNNENGLGFNFNNSGFTPRIRLEAKLKQGKYVSERNVYENSAGNKNVFYYKGRKSKNFCVDMQPEYVHDFLRLMLGADNVYLDGVLYACDDDEYNVEWVEPNDNVGKVRVLVSQRTQNVKNINCSDNENVCNLPPNYLILEDKKEVGLILLESGHRILLG